MTDSSRASAPQDTPRRLTPGNWVAIAAIAVTVLGGGLGGILSISAGRAQPADRRDRDRSGPAGRRTGTAGGIPSRAGRIAGRTRSLPGGTRSIPSGARGRDEGVERTPERNRPTIHRAVRPNGSEHRKASAAAHGSGSGKTTSRPDRELGNRAARAGAPVLQERTTPTPSPQPPPRALRLSPQASELSKIEPTSRTRQARKRTAATGRRGVERVAPPRPNRQAAPVNAGRPSAEPSSPYGGRPRTAERSRQPRRPVREAQQPAVRSRDRSASRPHYEAQQPGAEQPRFASIASASTIFPQPVQG